MRKRVCGSTETPSRPNFRWNVSAALITSKDPTKHYAIGFLRTFSAENPTTQPEIPSKSPVATSFKPPVLGNCTRFAVFPYELRPNTQKTSKIPQIEALGVRGEIEEGPVLRAGQQYSLEFVRGRRECVERLSLID